MKSPGGVLVGYLRDRRDAPGKRNREGPRERERDPRAERRGHERERDHRTELPLHVGGRHREAHEGHVGCRTLTAV